MPSSSDSTASRRVSSMTIPSRSGSRLSGNRKLPNFMPRSVASQCSASASFRRPRRGQLHRIRAVAVAERLGVDLLQLDLAREHFLLPFLMRRDVGVKFGHDVAREQFEALADVLVGVLAGL